MDLHLIMFANFRSVCISKISQIGNTIKFLVEDLLKISDSPTKEILCIWYMYSKADDDEENAI